MVDPIEERIEIDVNDPVGSLGDVAPGTVNCHVGRTIRQRMERDLYLMLNPRLDHLLEVNDFFVRLIKECRNTPDFAPFAPRRRCRFCH